MDSVKEMIFLGMLVLSLSHRAAPECLGKIDSVSCDGPGYHVCRVGSGDTIIEDAWVTTQESTTECNYHDGNYLDYAGNPGSFGFEENIIWVDKGCSATFGVCLVPGCPGTVTYLNCSSDSDYQKCQVPIRGQIIYATLETQYSSKQCLNYGLSIEPGDGIPQEYGPYGWYHDYLWVDRGCAGEFKICYDDHYCRIKGDPHFNTNDGKSYTYGGDSTYSLVVHPKITIHGDFFKCRSKRPHVSCLRALIITVKGYRIELMRGGNVSVFSSAPPPSGPVNLNFSSGDGSVQIYEILPKLVKIELAVQVVIYWDKEKVSWISLPFLFLGETMGLCGTYDYNRRNDFMTPDGSVTNDKNAFAESWAVATPENNGPS